MRRTAAYVSLTLFVMISISGCSLFRKKPPETGASALGGADTYIPPVDESAYGVDPYAAYGSPTQVASNAPVERAFQSEEPVYDSVGSTFEPIEQPAERSSGYRAGRFHTVVKRDTLFGLARMYYGDQRRWKDIYEANRSVLRDPDMIRIGQRLAIP